MGWSAKGSIKGPAGPQGPVSENATQSTLVKRTSEGRVKAAPGSAGDELVTKSQLDGKVDRYTGRVWAVYGRDGDTEKMMNYATSPDSYSLAQRTGDGTLRVADPSGDDHAATKKYVDGRTPAVKVVSSLPPTPLPGCIYLVTGA